MELEDVGYPNRIFELKPTHSLHCFAEMQRHRLFKPTTNHKTTLGSWIGGSSLALGAALSLPKILDTICSLSAQTLPVSFRLWLIVISARASLGGILSLIFPAFAQEKYTTLVVPNGASLLIQLSVLTQHRDASYRDMNFTQYTQFEVNGGPWWHIITKESIKFYIHASSL